AFIAPSLSYVPLLAMDTLRQLIEYALLKEEKVGLIGSSLGGYMAIALATQYNLKAVLINPSMKPTLTLENVTGLNYYDLSNFEWNTKHLNMLKFLHIEHLNPKNFLLLLQKGDEVLDYSEALQYFTHQGIASSQLIIEEGGNHSFENIESKFEIIDRFLELKSKT
ncbi:MAG: prolyl oligopeptidase family serine peptidase, partial [Campylobacterales bacterium]|nr:prolyl oligopeptidase family serine peptidase [Campylobacterales bacterium]